MRESLGGRAHRLEVLILTSTLWFLGKFVRYAFPPLFEQLTVVYEVSTAELGTAFSGLLFVYAILQFPSGLLADRFGPIAVLGGGATLAAAGALALAIDSPLVVLVGAMLVVGAGTGTLKTVGVGLLSRTYPTQTGRALGVFDTFGTFGGVLAPAAAVVFAGSDGFLGAGWRTTFLLAGVTGLCVSVAFVARVPIRSTESGTIEATDGGTVSIREYAALFGDPRFVVFVGVTVLFSFAYNAAVAFLPLYLTREAGLGAATASFLYSALFIVSFVQLATGEISDRTGTLPILALTLALASVGLGAVIFLTRTGSVLLLGGAVLCLGIGAHGYRPVRGAYLMSIIPDAVAGGTLGAVRTLLMIAGAFSPALVGFLSESAGFRPAFWLLTGALALATIGTIILWALK